MASLPPVACAHLLGEQGFDNQLLVGVLTDGRQVLRDRIDARAKELRREEPCLVHSDANFHNIVVGTDRVTLIDWDYPAVRYPLEELEGLEARLPPWVVRVASRVLRRIRQRGVTPAAAASSHRGLLGHVQLGVVRHSGRHPASCRSPVHAPHVG